MQITRWTRRSRQELKREISIDRAQERIDEDIFQELAYPHRALASVSVSGTGFGGATFYFSPGGFMKLRWHRQYLAPLVLIGLGLLTTRPAKAIFGIGDIVYWIQQISLMKQELQQMQQTVQTQANALKLWQNNFQALANKNTWRQWGTDLLNNPMANSYGETAPLATALNNGNNVIQAWRTATLPTQNLSALSGEKLGTSAHLAGLASIEAGDAASADTIQALASYRQQAAKNAAAFDQLQTTILSDDPAKNTLAAQQNLTNGALLQLIQREQTSTATTAALAQQQLIANTYMRNGQVQNLNNYAQFLNTLAQYAGEDSNGIGHSLQSADY
jgi:hypothetical protein